MRVLGSAVVAATLMAWAPALAMDRDTAVEKGRAAARTLNETLRGKLNEALEHAGPAYAIDVCANQARALSADTGKSLGVTVRRTSFRVRNPENAPDAYETEVLERLRAQALEGKLPGEVIERREEGGKAAWRYVKPIVVAPLCVTCHGPEDRIPVEVRRAIGEKYPDDRATGFREGDLRGIVSVLIPDS